MEQHKTPKPGSWCPGIRTSNPFRWILIASLSAFAFLSCEKLEPGKSVPNWKNLDDDHGNAFGTLGADLVLKWNQAAIEVVNQTARAIPDVPIPPFVESRFYAQVQIAIHDALNQIVPRYETYALQNARDKDANPQAAVAQAAYEVIVAHYDRLNPPVNQTPQSVKDMVSNLLNECLAQSGTGKSVEKGIALGKAAAGAILAARANDGVASAMFPVTEGNTPGAYRFTFPFNGPPFNTPPFSGLYDAPGWGNVKPFAMQSGQQFRAGPPDPVNSAAYTKDFNEVKSLGRFNSTTRTPEQTEIAKFWAESSPQGWNRIAVTLLKQKNQKAWQAARLLALLQIAEADAYISSLETKTHYFYWRPVSAIRLAATDGNPDTEADAEWEVLGWNPAGPPNVPFWPTPPVADYVSSHATAGGAGATVIAGFFGSDNLAFSTTSGTYASTRSYKKLSDAARENSLSRIYIGFHFRKACIEGENQGKKVGLWTFANVLKER